jgi:hypothetical protein
MNNDELKSIINTRNNAVLIVNHLRKDYLEGKINTNDFMECMLINQILIITNTITLHNHGIHKI